MKTLHSFSLSSQMKESLRLAGVQGFFWASLALGNYQTVYLQNHGFPASSFGLLNAISCTIAIIAMTFWSTISDKTGSVRKVTISVLTLGCFLYALVPLIPTNKPYSALLFLVLIPVINFFRAPMSPFMENLSVRNCAENGLNYGIIRSFGSLMFALSEVLAVFYLIPSLGFSSTFLGNLLFMIPAIILVYFCFEPQRGFKEDKNSSDLSILLKNRQFIAFLVFGFFYQMAVAFESNFLPYLMTDLNLDNTDVGLILCIRALMEIPFLFFISALRRYIKSQCLIIISALLMGIECLLFCFFVNSLPQMLLFAILFGFGNGIFIGVSTNYIYILAPSHLRATAHGMYISVSQISGITGSLLGGILFDMIGGKHFYFVAACTFFLSILIFTGSFKKNS